MEKIYELCIQITAHFNILRKDLDYFIRVPFFLSATIQLLINELPECYSNFLANKILPPAEFLNSFRD